MDKFVIPLTISELLNEPQDAQYYVKEIVTVNDCEQKLQSVFDDFEEKGLVAIVEYFDVYYSLLNQGDIVDTNEILRHFLNLRRVFERTDIPVEFELNAGERNKILNSFLMICYIFGELLQYVELKCQESAIKARVENVTKKRDKQKGSDLEEKWLSERRYTLKMIIKLFQKPIEKLWLPKKPAEDFINIFSSLLIQILRNEKIKNEKDVLESISDIYGILASRFTKSISFMYQIVELVKKNEHTVPIVVNIVQVMVEKYQCASILKKITAELTEWQMATDEERLESDNMATKNCSNLLAQLANSMSELMLPIISDSFETYLHANSCYFRRSILSIITDVILNLLSKEDLNDDEKSTRNKLFNFLLMHMTDLSSIVRTKVAQYFLKLQASEAIPLVFYFPIMEKAHSRLNDKTILVRKYSINLINRMIESNPFSANLNIDHVEHKLNDINSKLSNLHNTDSEWQNYEAEVKGVLEERINSGSLQSDDNDDDDDDDHETNDVHESVFYKCVKEHDFDGLIKSIKYYEKKNKTDAIRHVLPSNKQVKFLLLMVKEMFINSNHIEEVTVLHEQKIFYEDIHKLAILISEIAENLHKQIFSTTSNISIAAMEFFEIIYQFEVKNAIDGIIQLLEVLYTAKEDEKKQIYEIYKRVFLSSDNKKQSTKQIVTTLIALIDKLTIDQLKSLNEILCYLMESEEISGNVIEYLWDLFTNKSGNEDYKTRDLALKLITTFSEKNPKIIKNNMSLLIDYGFREIGTNNLKIVTSLCKAFLVLCTENQEDSNSAPFLLDIEHEFWILLQKIFVEGFDINDPHYIGFCQYASEVIYKMCSKPHLFTNQMFQELRESKLGNMANNVNNLINLIVLLGQLAYWNFSYLDNVIYTEIKKRANTRKSKRSHNTSVVSTDTTAQTIHDLADVEVITKIFDKYLVHEGGQNILSAFIPLIKKILTERNTFKNEKLQCATVLTLISYMLISRGFCDKFMQLLMTVLQKSRFETVKMNVLHGFSDLLNRFPNIVEPWIIYVQNQLKDGNPNVRKTGLTILQSLTLRESIRPKTCIAEIAMTLDDNEPSIVSLTEEFFKELSSKTNHLYNVIPEIISKLSDPNSGVTREQFAKVTSFVFALIQKDRQIDTLIDSLCKRLENLEDPNQFRSIVYCLSLFTYNEKRIEKLIQLFDCYKNKLADSEVYKVFRNIISDCEKTNKEDFARVVQELNDLIKTVPVPLNRAAEVVNPVPDEPDIENEQNIEPNEEERRCRVRKSDTFKVPKRLPRKRKK